MVDSLLGDQPALIAFELVPTPLLPYHNAAKARNMLQGCTAGSRVQMIFWPLLPSVTLHDTSEVQSLDLQLLSPSDKMLK